MRRVFSLIALSILVTGSFASFNAPAQAATTKPLPSSGKVELTLGASGKMPTTIYVPEGTGIKPLILVIHSSGKIQTSDYSSNVNGWMISSANNGFAEFEKKRLF